MITSDSAEMIMEFMIINPLLWNTLKLYENINFSF